MKKPNILLITTDQQRSDTICAQGYGHMYTPNLDALAREGCSYVNAYSANPVCMAARHNILTGLTARYHGFDDNYFDDNPRNIPYGLPTFPQLLSDDGYDTAAIGKMHFQPCRRHNGFTKMELMEEIPRFLEDDDYAMYLRDHGYGHIQSIHGVRHMLYMLPQRSLVDEEHHGSAWVAARSIDYLRENGGKRPFMMWSSFIAPHPPFDVPKGWTELYRDRELPPVKMSATPLSALAEENRAIADYPDEGYLRRAREFYYASISFADYNIGKIIQQLKDMGEYDNTFILFTSDHGEMLGDYGTYQKFLPYDSAAKVPFIIRYPERGLAKTTDSRFVDSNDILPTILDIAGIRYPEPGILPGESVLVQDGQKDRSVQYVEHCHGNRRWISLRDRQYKYNYYYGGGKEELFDMVHDPDETENLLAVWEKLDETRREELEERKNLLREKLVKTEARQGLEGCVQDGKLAVLDEYKPFFYRENNPPMFTGYQDTQYLSLEEEVMLAVEEEDTVDVHRLDLDYYEARGTIDRRRLETPSREQGRVIDWRTSC